ncbi:maltose alpha-D-glucosyltransferase [Fundidesulfovibrio terrae]|uniref:maltose alpha-D-glucosyltransferase n=1 Tax=Fundidesulfovibrio terrae TaxID=2922866 RepID=UPI001FAF724B|nr:maltose alpha-D-glucosyltransferase [Fundidesulfovibrio terrae]
MLTFDPLWYKKTIFYELHVRSFADGNADGIGDFTGLIDKLGYLERLGVGALWLLPFYPSPLRDDGYDIANYMDVHPDYGTLADFKRFLREAHHRGIRVVTELVLNHTSDQHPWFQRARKAKPGSAHRDFYVWSETPDKYGKARIIFKDFEHSNWAWDPVAKSNYWHRFYSHQPDLNFANPLVHRELFKVVDHWLGMGVDGLRLDAVPYLYEREGTNCENLPETHAFLKRLRSHVEARFPGRMLLAEANQWPEDAVDYFGQGDECHMAYDFPVMPRIFMALWMEDRYPIIDIVGQTPAIPETCQWAVFLRNHDELTLEMVSDEERDYMYRAYALDFKARINLGIRRRLAPLMQNNRRRMELINFLLFSFPGTPIIYYGDELAMGDNYHLGDRNGVRTPMQWSPDRNAGFSQANPQSLYLPVIIDPEYHYEVVNAETQERNQSSFLWWMRRIISLYKTFPALGTGELTFVRGDNTKVLSFLRTEGEQTLLVVANLSRYAQVEELDLESLAGCTPVEVFGQTRFPAIRKEPYCLTLGPHDHFWFVLEKGAAQPVQAIPRAPLSLTVDSEHGVAHRENLGKLKSVLLPTALARSLRGTASPGPLFDLKILDHLPIRNQEPGATLFVIDTVHGQAFQDHHLLFVSVAGGKRAEMFALDSQDAVLAHLADDKAGKILLDGFDDPEAVAGLAAFLASNRKYHGRSSRFIVDLRAPLSLRKALMHSSGPVRRVHSTRQTVSYSVGNRAFLKIFRHPEEGGHPEAEILSILNKAGFEGVPRLLARLAYLGPRGQAMTLALAMEFVQGATEGTAFVLDTVERFLDQVLASGLAPPWPLPADPFVAPVLTKEQQGMVDEYSLEFFRRLAQRIAHFHTILAGLDNPAFSPEPVTKLYLRSLYQTMRNLAHNTARGIERMWRAKAGDTDAVPRLLPETAILKRFAKLLNMEPTGVRIRAHGDLQLDNVLHMGRDFMLVDFDGDVRLPLGERTIKRPAIRDVACMIASMAVTTEKALRRHLERTPHAAHELTAWCFLWRRTAGLAFFDAYLEAVKGAILVPPQEDSVRQLLLVFLLEQLLRTLNRSLEEAPEDVPALIELTELLMEIFP